MPSLNPDRFRRPDASSPAKENAYRDYFGSLQDELLLWMRDGTWRKVSDAAAWVAPRMMAVFSVDRYLAAGGVRDRKLEHQFGEGKKLVIEDVLDSLRHRKLAAFREGDGGEQEIRSTPLSDPRFELDPDFEHAIPRAPEVVKQLEERLLVEEVREPLVVWKGHGLLVDGYVTFRFCALLGRTYPVIEMKFPDREAVVAWLYATHYGRGYTDKMKSLVHGNEYLSLKQNRGGTKGKGKRQDAAQTVGKKYGISRNTVLRDAEFAKAINRIAELAGDDLRQQVLSHELKWTRGDVQRLAMFKVDEAVEIICAAQESGKRPKLPARMPAVLISPAFRRLGHKEQFDLLRDALSQDGLDQLLTHMLAERAKKGTAINGACDE